ncbi:MAG: aldehyde dehydrogenase family protein [Ardenticatenaceae bacterium]|nr:aldehyde dehydrogenase family protein [Anaerolineales bacterium]MCB8942061.1 aldehyde dehydrogenase family protein [Ardenticatenaceae bacterium]MCB8973179.1 aldehyde dehydrogenase family protein [Ardenticatenaceae bacterium]
MMGTMTVTGEVIKGQPLNGKAEFLPFVNPATGEQFGSVMMHTEADVKNVRREMATAGRTWAAKPVKERVRIVRQLQTLLIDEMDAITAVMNQDNGKSRQDALAELFMSVDLINQYCNRAPHWLRRRRISPGLQIFKRCYIEQHPHGVVGIIGPWNYPLVLIMPPVVSALLAGNTVLVKPSEVTAATGVMIEKLIQKLPELAPFVRFLHGDGRVGAALVQSKPDLIFLTGSTKTGRLVMKAAAENMTPVVCELGGKDPMIVLEDADIAAAARWGAWGAFYNTGQTCMAVERIYVVETVYDRFLEAFIEETRKLKQGYSPEIENPNDLGPLTFQRQVNIIEDHVQDALAKGAHIIHGGKREGMYMEPTVMVNVDHSMKLMREETFGPVVPIMMVDDEMHAIQLANDSNLGLSASVWSRDLDRAQRVAHQLYVGSVNINDTMSHFAIPRLPFGGVKESGIGRTHGKKDLLQFTQTRAFVVGNPPLPFDIATILRQPGNYKLGSSIIHLVFGTTPKQKLKPVVELLEEKEVKPKVKKVGTAVTVTAALAAAIFAFVLRTKK